MGQPRSSVILWEGPSAINGKKIAVIATGLKEGSKNRKTGERTIQIWVIPGAEGTARELSENGKDKAICGSCPLRPVTAKKNGTTVCYVQKQIRISHGAAQVVLAYQRGSYERATKKDIEKALLKQPLVRWGAWGDPLAIPRYVFERSSIFRLLLSSVRHTGYTRRWLGLDADTARWAQKWLMASCHTASEAKLADAAGWRYFRTRAKNSELLIGERGCPASKEMGHKLTCGTCRACDGVSRGASRPSISIVIH